MVRTDVASSDGFLPNTYRSVTPIVSTTRPRTSRWPKVEDPRGRTDKALQYNGARVGMLRQAALLRGLGACQPALLRS